MAADFGDKLIVMLEIPTVAVATLLVPPMPLQVNEYVEFVVMAPVP
jgi:hypothetical protein